VLNFFDLISDTSELLRYFDDQLTWRCSGFANFNLHNLIHFCGLNTEL